MIENNRGEPIRTLADWQALLVQSAGPLPRKTTAYQTWALRLAEEATSETTRAELPYWLAQTAASEPSTVTTLGELASLECLLDRDDTIGVHDAARTLGSGMRDVLVWAVASAYAGGGACTIATTGHGRESLFDDVDVSRTVGWFQVLYPVHLKQTRSVAAVVQEFANVPRNGIGYGLLRYAGDPDTRRRLAELTAPRIAVNYMGTFGFEDVAPGTLSVCTAPLGLAGDGEVPRQREQTLVARRRSHGGQDRKSVV